VPRLQLKQHSSDATSTRKSHFVTCLLATGTDTSSQAKSRHASTIAHPKDTNTQVSNGQVSAGVTTHTANTEKPRKIQTRNAIAEWELRSSLSGEIAFTI
jgi:hypothetical protein